MGKNTYTVRLIKGPGEADWFEVKRRALVTVGREVANPATSEWKRRILEARHSPIRYLRYSFMLEKIPYWVACELRTHVHDMPYVSDFGVYIRSSRNDRQKKFDRNAARQDAPVDMVMDVNAEQIQILANKRLCRKATQEARDIVQKMCQQAIGATPELDGLLVPMCQHCGGVCHEMEPCGEGKEYENEATARGLP